MDVRGLQFAIAAASGQDLLLQSSRRFHATIAAGLLTVGAILLVGIALAPPVAGMPLMLALASVALASLAISRRMVGMSLARSRTVAWWQHRIVILEGNLAPEDRHFTAFKQSQSRQAEYPSDPEALATALITYGMTANVYDVAVPRILRVVWLTIAVAAVVLRLGTM